MQSFVLSYRLSQKPRSYKLFYGSFNPDEYPNFAAEVLTPEGIAKYKKLETAFHFKTGFIQIHCNKDTLYILVTYRNQPRIFRLRSPLRVYSKLLTYCQRPRLVLCWQPTLSGFRIQSNSFPTQFSWRLNRRTG